MTAGIFLDANNQGVVSGLNVSVFGGQHSVIQRGGSFICRAFISEGSERGGIDCDFTAGNGGSLRLDEAGISSRTVFAPPPVPWIGIKIANGGGHVLKSVFIGGLYGVGPFLPNSWGLRLGKVADSINSVELFDLLVINVETLAQVGDVAEQASDITIRDLSGFGAGLNGVRLAGVNVSSCEISGCIIQMNPPLGTTCVGIEAFGSLHRISKNVVDLSSADPAQPNAGVTLQGGSLNIVVEGNTISGVSSGPLMPTSCTNSSIANNSVDKTNDDVTAVMTVGANGNTVTGNRCVNPAGAGSTAPAITCAGALCTFTGNRTRTALNVAGIDLTGTPNTAVGNACENAPVGAPITFVLGNIVGFNAP